MKPRGIHETILYASDLDAAESFYTTVIGLEKLGGNPGRSISFRVGDQVLLIFNPAETIKGDIVVGNASIPAHGSTGPGHMAFSIQPESIDDWIEHLKSGGIAIESIINWPDKNSRSVYIRDPAGNSIEFITPGLWFDD